MLPNSQTHCPPTRARVKYGKKCPGPGGGSTHPAPLTMSQPCSVALVSVTNCIPEYPRPRVVGDSCRNGLGNRFGCTEVGQSARYDVPS